MTPNYVSLIEPFISHSSLKDWILEVANLAQPDSICVLNGSESEKTRLEAEALASGELVKLNPAVLPGCFYHRSSSNDVARTENLTYICAQNQKDAGPTNNWMDPSEAYAKAVKILAGSMRGRTLYVIPFSMGPVHSAFSKIGVELTDSVYVALNMRIMTRVGQAALDRLGSDGVYTKCLHGKADLDINRRLVLHFPQDNAIWSVGSGYGGNALLGKKCLALRIASALGRKEGWMAEHMLILGVEKPDGTKFYIAAAFPSACGKTNLAMLTPPETLRKKGYKIWTVGDDIAWLHINEQGGLSAINPEAGCFGVVSGTNSKSNINAMRMIGKNTIFTNVALKKDGTVWWEGHDDPAPDSALDWKAEPWTPGLKGVDGKLVKAAHPNSRFTASIRQCPCVSSEVDNEFGVPISAILFGGRRAGVAPLVMESFSWNHGVYLGATMASERTAAQTGNVGEVRRDPMAMLPFCGYNMGEYFEHWINMGRKMQRPPRIYHVNWFRTDEKNNLLWPGFGENLRILEWILQRCEGRVNAIESPVGGLPKVKDVDLSGLNLGPGVWDQLFVVNKKEWLEEQRAQEE